ncbi:MULTISPECIES: GIY-YIG nuclease family protein [Niastella]|uniref:GIY-YIG nuclease family protein n=1 Tax=Niastella soli TaxID=2821487 RepID=A0ABS3YRR5_9BACT|nr:GIY-YIG nuclease family protein [Niastella soli]MBO9200611.1 GIY-YIG nuclease family protein [Niastella soli]
MESTQGIVYILTNPAIPNMIKIGMTSQEDVKYRMAQLYNSGVPLPFECVYAAKVSNFEKVEKALHIAFGPDRVNPKREFFAIDPAQAIAIIKLMEIEDVTPKVANEKETVDEVDREAGVEYARKNRPRLNFNDMNIPIDSELVSVENGEVVTVVSDRTIRFRGEETSLSNATKIILDIEYHVAPGPYWTYNGRKLKDIYNETYPMQ